MQIEDIEISNKKDLEILNDIEQKIIENINLGYDPQILEILDNERASSQQIEQLKDKLTKDIVVRLFKMSKAIYFGKLFGGEVNTFFDVIMRLGMMPAKIYISALSIFSMSPNKEFRILAARSFATSVLGRLLATEMRLHDVEVKKIETGGLFLEIGKLITILYRLRFQKEAIDEKFTSKYSPYLGLKIIRKFNLPAFLNEILFSPYLRFTDDSFHMSSIVTLANSMADKSFKAHGRLVIQSPMPGPDGLLASTPGSIISDQFMAVGLGEYIEVNPDKEARLII
ncbi:MAG: HDOD domain-containing protein [Nitrospirae bacterium]|nr:HDOD domain-containing protein [Nitrospirota bacterium]